MATKVLLTFILIQTIYSAQTDIGIEKKYHKNGNVKFIAIKRGVDTIEFKGYYKNGQLKDSVWLYISGRQEVPLGTGKTYYSNGTIETITHYKNGNDEYIKYGYHRNGKLERFVQTPTGLTKFYNKKGEQIREYDNHKSKDIYVSKDFRKGRHLINSSIPNRIQNKKAVIIQDNKEFKLVSGVLISLTLNSDTVPLTHCQIEGFSKDSLYISKFHYSENYTRGSGLNILKYDSTFALSFNQINILYYARHKDRKRLFGALTAMITGIDLMIVPVVGLPLFYYGKYLFKTMVPKAYDMRKSKVLLWT